MTNMSSKNCPRRLLKIYMNKEYLEVQKFGWRVIFKMQSKVCHFANILQTCIDKKAHFVGKRLHAQIIVNGLFSNIFLSNRLIEFYYKCRDLGSARQVFDKMPGRNIYTWNAIVTAFCKAGNLQDALQLFMAMPERNTVSWNTVISSLVQSGLESEALDYYNMMHREGFGPTHFTFASVLSACGTLMEVGHGRRCHSTVIKVGLDHNKYVENALVGMYAKCGIIDDAIQVFGEMCHPNEVSFTAMMGGLAQTDHVEEALTMFTKMHTMGIRIDPVSLSGVLSVCARGESEYGVPCYVHGQQVHCLTVKLGFELDLHVGNSLIDMYAKNENMETAEMLFASLPEVNNVSWNILIAGYGQMGRCDKAIEWLERMQRHGFEPDEVTYISMLGACVKSGDMETGCQMFEKMSNPRVSSWNALLSGYSQKGNHEEALKFFRMMQSLSVQPDRTTLAIVLNSCAGMGFLKGGKQVHAVLTKASFQADIFVASGLIDMYSKSESIELAQRFFDRMPERDIVCWNSMISGFALHSLHREAFTLFQQLQEKGMRPSQFSYASVLSSCARLASLSQGRQIHAQIAKDGHASDVFVGSALIDMYSRCGDIDAARHFFNEMTNKNTVSWNEMIHGYAQNGCGEKAVELFKDMILSGEKPDSITFIAVLTACSHSGLVDEGVKIFNSMEQGHGVEPLADHYTCIIDSLGRAGRFGEAEVIVNKMPCKDDPIIWEVLLSSCRVHANINLGKRAAEQLFRLDPRNPAPYVLLSNIYAALGRWDDASAVRALMGDRDVVKYPGYSWIEFKNEVQAFMVDDDLSKVDDGNPLSTEMIQNISRGGTCAT